MVLTNLIGCVKVDIMNLRRVKPSEPYDFRIDRPSPLSNPPYHKGTRNEKIDKYGTYFDKRILVDRLMRLEIERMIIAHKKYGIVRLFCWCHPKRCHGEKVKQFLIKCFED